MTGSCASGGGAGGSVDSDNGERIRDTGVRGVESITASISSRT